MALAAIRAAFPTIFSETGVPAGNVYTYPMGNIPSPPSIQIWLAGIAPEVYVPGNSNGKQRTLYTYNLRLYLPNTDERGAEDLLTTMVDTFKTVCNRHRRAGWPDTVVETLLGDGTPTWFRVDKVTYRGIRWLFTILEEELAIYA